MKTKLASTFLVLSLAATTLAFGQSASSQPSGSSASAGKTPTGKQNQPSTTQKQAMVELTTDPSPAQKGSNTVRVKLTDSAGKPITGAQVTVTFSMPAMPTMGMAAMKTVIKATEAGAGTYEGRGHLGSGGTWRVTVTAQQDGKTIAKKQLTVKATGGM